MEQLFLSGSTDTVTPITPVPIFSMHVGEHPFYLNGDCICHANEARLKELLQGVLDGDLKLQGV